MVITINTDKKRDNAKLPAVLQGILPYRLCAELRGCADRVTRIEEIRIRSGKRVFITADGRNIMLDTVITRDDLENFIHAVCDNSLYAHRDTISKGYVTLSGGIRIGICGRAAIENGNVLGVYDISSVNIRIPHFFNHIGEPVCRLIRERKGTAGVLVYAPPGIGKTTLLRSVASKISSSENAERVVVIDTRGELGCFFSDEKMSVDVLSGYPRTLGIDIATRYMNAEICICDEIGDIDEAKAIVASQNCGVRFLASAHSDSLDALLRRSAVAILHEARVFDSYVGIKRGSGTDFIYTVNSWEDADALVHSDRSSGSSSLRN